MVILTIELKISEQNMQIMSSISISMKWNDYDLLCESITDYVWNSY
jgi:hypothetical protein